MIRAVVKEGNGISKFEWRRQVREQQAEAREKGESRKPIYTEGDLGRLAAEIRKLEGVSSEKTGAEVIKRRRAKKYAPPGQCPWCDALAAEAAERTKRHRDRKKNGVPAL